MTNLIGKSAKLTNAIASHLHNSCKYYPFAFTRQRTQKKLSQNPLRADFLLHIICICIRIALKTRPARGPHCHGFGVNRAPTVPPAAWPLTRFRPNPSPPLTTPGATMNRNVLLCLVALTISLTAWRCGATESWPAFRGDGDSIVRGTSGPLSWEPQGRSPGNWSARLPGYGQSSPVVWEETIFVTAVSGDEKERFHVLALAMSDGQVRWQHDGTSTQRIPDSDTVSRGAPTPVVDSQRLYCVFESGDVVALTHDGKVVWEYSFVKSHGEVRGPHGYASSPLLIDGVLILQVAHAGPSYAIALDAASGAVRWKADHPSENGWSSPVAIEHQGEKGLVISTSGSVRALRATDGATWWYVNGLRGNGTATPTVAGDVVVIGVSEGRGGGRRRPIAGERNEGRGRGARMPSDPIRWQR
jgi:hypothetical protein